MSIDKVFLNADRGASFSESLVEPRLQNIIFRANKKSALSKRSPFYIKYWAS